VSVARLLPDYEGAVAAGEGELRPVGLAALDVESVWRCRATAGRRDLLERTASTRASRWSACSGPAMRWRWSSTSGRSLQRW